MNSSGRQAGIWVAGVVVALLLIVLLTNSSSGTPTTGTSSSSGQAPVATDNQVIATADSQKAPTPKANSTDPKTSVSKEELCATAAQKTADIDTQGQVKYNNLPNTPPSAYFVDRSHYASSLNACYITLHWQSQAILNYGTLTWMNYGLFIATVPVNENIAQTIAAPFIEVADCTVQSDSSTSCHYYGAQKVSNKGDSNFDWWIQQYGSNSAPTMAYQDYVNLVSKALTSN